MDEEPTSWEVRYTRTAATQLAKLEAGDRRRLRAYVAERVLQDPRRVGQPLKGDLAGLWRYRVGNFRIVTVIEDAVVTVTVVTTEHRSSVYRR